MNVSDTAPAESVSEAAKAEEIDAIIDEGEIDFITDITDSTDTAINTDVETARPIQESNPSIKETQTPTDSKSSKHIKEEETDKGHGDDTSQKPDENKDEGENKDISKEPERNEGEVDFFI